MERTRRDKEDPRRPTLALFYCQRTPGSGEEERQSLEGQFGKSLRLFPLPCGGRLEPLHLLKALEGFADAAYLITCPEAACRFFEGNRRARKRVERAQWFIEGIGLERDRIGIMVRSREDGRSLSGLAQELVALAARLGPSPVHG